MDQPVGGDHVGGDQGVQPLDRGYPGVVVEDLCFVPAHLAWEDTGPPHGRQAGPTGDRRARYDYKNPMRAVLKTNNPVVLNYAANVLLQEGIESVVFDTHCQCHGWQHGFSAAPADGAGRGFRSRPQAAAPSHAGCDVTETFLDGRVMVTQPGQGFRSGLDAVMLAAAVPARAGENALELGSGAGTGSLCLAARIKGIAITGVEIDPSLVELATTNAAANGGDVPISSRPISSALPPELKRDFDQVFCNPPFHGEGTGHRPTPPARPRSAMAAG